MFEDFGKFDISSLLACVGDNEECIVLFIQTAHRSIGEWISYLASFLNLVPDVTVLILTLGIDIIK